MIETGQRVRHYKGQVYKIVGDGSIANKDELVILEEVGKVVETITTDATYENTMEKMTIVKITNRDYTSIIAMFNEPTEENRKLQFQNVIAYYNPELDQYWVRTVRDFTSLVEGDVPVGTRRFTLVD